MRELVLISIWLLYVQEVAPKLIAGIAEYIVKVGLGDKRQEVGKGGWLKYVKAQMYEPPHLPIKYKSFL